MDACRCARWSCLPLPSRASHLDDQLAGRSDPAVVALEEDSRGAKLLHDGRSSDARAGRERIALIDRAAHRLLGVEKVDVSVARGLRRAPLAEPREGELRALADRAEPHVHHLDRLIRRMMRVTVLIERIERLPDRFAVAGFELPERDRHRQAELLPDITQIERDLLLGTTRVP